MMPLGNAFCFVEIILKRNTRERKKHGEREETIMVLLATPRRQRQRRLFANAIFVSFFVFVSVSFWFTNETENLVNVFEESEFLDFAREVKNTNEKMKEQREERANGREENTVKPLRRRTLKDYAAILFTQNLCFDYFVANGGPYFCLYPVLCFGSDFYSCMTNAGVVQEAYGIDAQSAYSVGNSIMNSF